MFGVGIDKVLSQLDVCAWLVLAFKTRVKGFLRYTTNFSFFVKCELNLTSPAPSALGHKLRFSLVSCLSQSMKHLGGMQCNPTSL